MKQGAGGDTAKKIFCSREPTLPRLGKSEITSENNSVLARVAKTP